MNCPLCNYDDSKVTDSRPNHHEGARVIKRRRRCFSCDHRWTTIEIALDDYTALTSGTVTMVDIPVDHVIGLAAIGEIVASMQRDALPMRRQPIDEEPETDNLPDLRGIDLEQVA